MPPKPRPLSERFWKKVKKTPECWIWTACRTAAGYGQIQIGNAALGLRAEYAHRISYELANGPIPNGFHVLHRCDNPPCVNPSHLFLGSNHDNRIDSARKLRTRHNVLTPEQVTQIRAAYKTGISQDALARAYDVSQTNISAIIRGVTWTWLEPPT